MTQPSKFWQRRAQVRVQYLKAQTAQIVESLGPGDVTGASPLTETTPALAVQVGTPLRIQFKVEKLPFMQPNTADISITNLAQATRRKLQLLGGIVELEGGYEENKLVAPAGANRWPILFRGNVRTIDHVRHGPDWVTRVQAGDGETAYRYARVNMNRGAGISVGQVISDMALQLRDEFQIDVTGFLAELQSSRLAMLQFKTGFSAQGLLLDEMRKLLAPGVMLSIQNHALRAIPPNGIAHPTSIDVPLISPETGLLGSPEHATPKDLGLPPLLLVTSLLLPRLEPGDSFRLKSESGIGDFRAERVTHVGDSHSGDWKTQIEARPLVPQTVAA